MVLPPQEDFSPLAAGAIAIVVSRLALSTPRAVVLGRAPTEPGFANIAFLPTAARRAGRIFHKLGVIRRIAALQPAWAEVHQDPRLARLLARLFPATRIALVLHNDPLTMRGLKRIAERQAMLQRADVVTVSPHLAQLYATGFDTLPARLQAIPNPVPPPERVAPLESRRREFLFVGRVTPDKGVDVFLEACRRVLPGLPGWSARIVGGDRYGPNQSGSPFYRQILARAAEVGITCTGYVPQDQVVAAMSEAAIMAMPSRMIEGFPLAAIEALANGVPLIATRSGGLPDAAGEAAVYVPGNDPDALAAAMHRLASDETARRDLVRAGLARAAELAPARIVAAWERFRSATASDMPGVQSG